MIRRQGLGVSMPSMTSSNPSATSSWTPGLCDVQRSLHLILPRPSYLHCAYSTSGFKCCTILQAPTSHLTTVPLPSQASAAMASRVLIPRLATASRSIRPTTPFLSRSFQTSRSRLQEAVAVPVKKPVGAFRGGSVKPNKSRIRSLQVELVKAACRLLRPTEASKCRIES